MAQSEKPKKDIIELEKELEALTKGWQRTQADFINYKKQAESDRVRIAKTAKSDLIEELLPVLDNFALAAKHLPDDLKDNSWAQGVAQVEKQFESILSDQGLERIESVGKEFDPNIHESVEEVKSEKPEGVVVEEIAAGFTLDGLTVRPAKVKVSSGKD